MCTIADAKVRQNYNCYNVYFYECLPCFEHLVPNLNDFIGNFCNVFKLSLIPHIRWLKGL